MVIWHRKRRFVIVSFVDTVKNYLAHFVATSIRYILNANQLATEVQAWGVKPLGIKLVQI